MKVLTYEEGGGISKRTGVEGGRNLEFLFRTFFMDGPQGHLYDQSVVLKEGIFEHHRKKILLVGD